VPSWHDRTSPEKVTHAFLPEPVLGLARDRGVPRITIRSDPAQARRTGGLKQCAADRSSHLLGQEKRRKDHPLLADPDCAVNR
jgi:hypothetical protein